MPPKLQGGRVELIYVIEEDNIMPTICVLVPKEFHWGISEQRALAPDGIPSMHPTHWG